MKNKPKRMFKNRHISEKPILVVPPEFPKEQVDLLKKARERINPFEVHRIQMPDGTIFQQTGAEMIAYAEAAVSLAEAINRGESASVVAAAFKKLDRLIDEESQ